MVLPNLLPNFLVAKQIMTGLTRWPQTEVFHRIASQFATSIGTGNKGVAAANCRRRKDQELASKGPWGWQPLDSFVMTFLFNYA